MTTEREQHAKNSAEIARRTKNHALTQTLGVQNQYGKLSNKKIPKYQNSRKWANLKTRQIFYVLFSNVEPSAPKQKQSLYITGFNCTRWIQLLVGTFPQMHRNRLENAITPNVKHT